jgi:hypothetical protein
VWAAVGRFGVGGGVELKPQHVERASPMPSPKAGSSLRASIGPQPFQKGCTTQVHQGTCWELPLALLPPHPVPPWPWGESDWGPKGHHVGED